MKVDCPQRRRKLHRSQQLRGNSNKDYINIPLSTKQSRSLAFAVPSLSTRIPGQKRCSLVVLWEPLNSLDAGQRCTEEIESVSGSYHLSREPSMPGKTFSDTKS